MGRGTNLPAVGGYNQTVILDLIRRSGDGASRVELAQQTGLSAQTISNISRRLLDSGMVREAGKSIVGPGKPRTILQLSPEGRYAVGVHLDPSVITFVLLGLEGQVVAHSRSRTPSDVRPADVVRRIASAVGALIESSGVPRDRIIGLGIASPGPIDRERGVVLDAPLLVGWKRVLLRDALLEATGLPVLLEKDVTAAAVAELWTTARRDRDNLVFFYYGTGFGVGIALHHEVVRGRSGNAGEAGHILTHTPPGRDAPACTCGRRGCVGTAIMPVHLVGEAIRAGVLAAPPGPLDAAAVDELFTHLARKAEAEGPARQILREAARAASDALVTVLNLLDVDTVVFGGPFWSRVSDVFLADIPRMLAKDPALLRVHPVTVTASSIGEDVAAVGAACLVLDNALSPRPSALLIST